jgi:site-specific recombinase XerD
MVPDQAPDPRPALTYAISFFDLSLRAARRSENTRACYIRAADKFADWLTGRGVVRFTDVDHKVIQSYMAWLSEDARKPNGKPLAAGYVNNQYRAIQAFFKWFANEEDVPNPMLGTQSPAIGETVDQVLSRDDLARLVKSVEKGRDFESRRDAAIIRFFACAGVRLSELTNLLIDEIDLPGCTAIVTGKGNKQRIVKFDLNCATALKRYLGVRAEHKLATRTERLWLGIKNRGPMTPSGVRQIIERRGEAIGLDIHPHVFRHTFSHHWLDQGGAEGDLMALNGWTSAQMLRRYGRSARSARAQRAYDRINVMGDI